MGNRTFNLMVVAFWLATMSWLIVEKVLPEYRRGEPPDFRAVQRAKQVEDQAPCWNISWDNTDLGWAASKMVPGPADGAELRTRIQLTRLPAQQLGQSLLRRLLTSMVVRDQNVNVRVDSRMQLNEASRVRGFQSHVYVGDLSSPLLNLDGRVQGPKLKLSFNVSQSVPVAISAIPLKAEWTVPFSDQVPLDDSTAPRGFMPPLKLNQSWKERVYSPLRLSNNLLGLTDEVEAKVEREETILWDAGLPRLQVEKCWLVVYRQDSGAGSESADKPLGWMWVRISDGMVLWQQLNMFGARLKFVRMHSAAAAERSKALDWDSAAWSEEKPATTEPTPQETSPKKSDKK